jgi:MoaA/NifB/PqqE/SkfB family radical SAM enzyme
MDGKDWFKISNEQGYYRMIPVYHPFLIRRGSKVMQRINRKLLRRSILRSDFSIPLAPEYLILTLSDKCNLHCPHCSTHGYGKGKGTFKDMNFQSCLPRIRGVLPYVSDYSITISGEPLLVKNFEEIVLRMSKFGAKLNLVTNGTLITKDNVDIISNYSSFITLSVDGARPETVEKLRKGANFSQLLINIKFLVNHIKKMEKSKQPIIGINFTVMGSNISEMPNVVEMAHFLEIKHVQFIPIQIYEGQDLIQGEAVEYHYDKFMNNLKKSKEIAEKLGIHISFPLNFDNIRPKNEFDPAIKEKMIIPEDELSSRSDPSEPFYEKIDKIFDDFQKKNDTMNIELAKKEKCTIREYLRFYKMYFFEIVTYLKYGDLFSKENGDARGNFNAIQNENKKITYCDALYKRVYISSEGDVAPCCIPGRPTLGNIFRQDLFEIYNGDEYRRFRERFDSLSPPACCKGCLFRQEITKDILINAMK